MIIPIYELPLNFTTNTKTWSKIYVLERLSYHKKITYKLNYDRTTKMWMLTIVTPDENPHVIPNTEFHNFLYTNIHQRKNMKELFLETYSAVYTRRALINFLSIVKYFPNNNLNMLTRDVLGIISSMVWKSRNDVCWFFSEHYMIKELGVLGKEEITTMNMNAKEDFEFLAKCGSVPIWLHANYKARVDKQYLP